MSNQLKSASGDFNYTFSLSRISHEIRNPLTLIYSTAQLLALKHPDLNRDELWGQLIKDIDYLNELTDSISFYNHCAQLSLEKTDLSQLLNSVVDSYRPLSDKTGIRLKLSLKNQLPAILCDRVKLRQCLINLLKNSFEATSVGDTISITAFSNARHVQLIVSDTGKGICASHLEHIFEPFTTYKKDGTGLGLAITKQIIEAHHGSIKVFSKPGKGTSFILCLPLSLPQTQC